MNRLLKSSNFWNAIVASALLFAACKLDCTGITDYIFFLFAGKVAVSGLKDYTRAKNGVEYNKKEDKFEKI